MLCKSDKHSIIIIIILSGGGACRGAAAAALLPLLPRDLSASAKEVAAEFGHAGCHNNDPSTPHTTAGICTGTQRAPLPGRAWRHAPLMNCRPRGSPRPVLVPTARLLSLAWGYPVSIITLLLAHLAY